MTIEKHQLPASRAAGPYPSAQWDTGYIWKKVTEIVDIIIYQADNQYITE